MKCLEILLVEDNMGDIDLAREALDSNRIDNHLHVARNGEEAMDFLKQTGLYANVPRPDIIILDLNLPRKDGRAVLAELKQNISLKDIPIVILTSAKAEEDIIGRYNLHANCYMTKPLDFHSFVKVMESIKDFWLSTVEQAKTQ
jgi:CheY-like chemotaxis protein